MKIGILMGLTDQQKGWLATNICSYLTTHSRLEGHIIQPLFGDFSKREIWEKIFENESYDCIINAVGYRGEKSIKELETDDAKKETSFKSNFGVVGYAVEYCSKYGMILIQLSTACVLDGYIRSPENGFSEDSIARPDNFGDPYGSIYGRHKWWAEEYIRKYHHLLSVILRIHLPFNGDHVDANIIHRMKDFKKVYNSKQSMTYVHDLCKFVLICVNKMDQVRGQLFNVVNSPPLSMAEVALYALPYFGVEYKPQPIQGDEVGIILNNSKIFELFNPQSLGLVIMDSFKQYIK